MTDETVSETVSETIALLRETGALLEGHFLLSSGLHSGHYFQCARLLQHPRLAAETGEALASVCRSLNAEVVVSPALGGLIIGHEAARALGRRAIFAERVDGTLVFRRGFALEKGERVLVVEDVVTTGKTSLETVKAIEDAGGEVIGLASIVDRSGGIDFPAPFHSLVRLATPAFEAGECPICKEGGPPLVKPGSRTVPEA